MNSIRLEANAKLNLTLDITGRREDGYHLMDMVMLSVNLFDTVSISKNQQGLSLFSNSRFLPRDERNVAVKAAQLLAQYCERDTFNVTIHIKKNIPTQAGLGGGSADAAATLRGLNELFELGVSEPELLKLAERVGADVPFCLTGGCARVRGIGELIEPLPLPNDVWFVITMPRCGSSTRAVFERYDAAQELRRPDTAAMVRAVENGAAREIGALCGNVFEQLQEGDETRELKKMLLECGARGAALTGSGAAVFGVFTDQAEARRCRARLYQKVFRCFLASPRPRGIKY